MDLYSKIIEIYPELTITATFDPFFDGTIQLRDDGDGIQYIAKWDYSKPIPDGLKLGK
jgi:hypothetical protein